ncbi:hypothetical protein BCR42DRAFT_482875 [Absidia repens]|uniref:RING/Ubox like zinc-binding domain-domain-containing protein n=1 Tax=Absidia repens TaxID=90262 RepID=A0A1X2IEH6_9FUNG|nr:hypothetical protein BCR42DRAFT_482875 [Absidia repens]
MYESDDEDLDCPLCMEELDIADRSFRPCTCGYQICRFCWHHIKENLNGRCPACRREYSDQMAEFEPISADEITRIKREKKEKERQQKDMEAVNRRHLANMRVVQKNLVYVIGLHPKYATEDVIRSNDYFGQFGKIAKVVINKRNVAVTSHVSGTSSMQPSAAVYVTYQRKEDADKAIQTVDGHAIAGRTLRASYGTTKYCTYYLRNMTCPNPSCLYLHEPGEEADTISKEELATGKHRMRDQISTDDDDDDHNNSGEHRSSASMVSSSSNSHLSTYHPSPSISSHDFPPVGMSSTVSTTTSSSSSAVRKPPTLDSVASISYKASPTRQHSHSSSSPSSNLSDQQGDDERSALPATASWAKLGNLSGPSTPVLKTALPDRTLTPDNFGPPLAVAAAASQKQQPQQQPLSPSAMKRKIEKKKRKELQKNRDSVASPSSSSLLLGKSKSSSTTSSSSHPSTPILVTTNSGTATTAAAAVAADSISPLSSMRTLNDALVNFVLGDAMNQVGWPLPQDLDETPLGVSALHEMEEENNSKGQQGLSSSSSTSSSTPSSSQQLTPPPTLNNTMATKGQHEEESISTINTLDFLLNAVPTPTYRGSFNPFAHQILRSSNNLFESPMRKTSRFGFAQI